MLVMEPLMIQARLLVLFGCWVLVAGQNVKRTATTTAKEDLISPNYPSNYGNNVIWTYLVTADEGLVITLSVVDCEMEFETKAGLCIYDRLFIYNGANDSMPQLVDFCCVRQTGAWVTTTHHAYLKFTTDNAINFRGFKLSYKSSVPPPSEEESSSTGVIVGVVIGVVVLLVIIFFVVRYFIKKKKIFVKSPRDDQQELWRSHSDISRELTFFERARTFICQAPTTLTTFIRRTRDKVTQVRPAKGGPGSSPPRPPRPPAPRVPDYLSGDERPGTSGTGARDLPRDLARQSSRASLPGTVTLDDKLEPNLSDLERRDVLLPLDGDSLRKMAIPIESDGIFDPFSGSTYEKRPVTPHRRETPEVEPVASYSGDDYVKRPITPHNTFIGVPGVPIKPYIGDAETKAEIPYPYRVDSAEEKPVTPFHGDTSARRPTPSSRGDTPEKRPITPYRRGSTPEKRPVTPYRRGSTPEERSTTPYRGNPYEDSPITSYRGKAPAKRFRDDTSYNRPLSPYSDEFYEQAPPTPYTGRTEPPYKRTPKRPPIKQHQDDQSDKSFRGRPLDRRPLTTYSDDSLDQTSTTPFRGRPMGTESETPFRGRSHDQRSLTPSTDDSYLNRPLTPFIGEPFERKIDGPFRSKTAGIRPETAESEGEFDYAFEKQSATPVSGRTTETRSVSSHKGQKLDEHVVKRLEKRPITPYGEITFLEHVTDTPFIGGTHEQRSSTPLHSGGRSRKRPLTPVRGKSGLFEQAL